MSDSEDSTHSSLLHPALTHPPSKLLVGIGEDLEVGQGENSQFGPVLPTDDPSGQSLASEVQLFPVGDIEGGFSYLFDHRPN